VTADPLARFEREHQEALAALDRLERAAHELDRPGKHDTDLAAAREVCAFLSGPVKAHNENEELALFPELGGDAPTTPFAQEHVALWRLERELETALGAADAPAAATAARAVIDLLRAHIARENEVLFPMARRLLGEEGLARVARRLAD